MSLARCPHTISPLTLHLTGPSDNFTPALLPCPSRPRSHLISATVYDWTAQQAAQWQKRKQSVLAAADWWRPGGGRPRYTDANAINTTPQNARGQPSPLQSHPTVGRGKNTFSCRPSPAHSPVTCVAHPIAAAAAASSANAAARATPQPLSPAELKEARKIEWLQGGNPWADTGFEPHTGHANPYLERRLARPK